VIPGPPGFVSIGGRGIFFIRGFWPVGKKIFGGGGGGGPVLIFGTPPFCLECHLSPANFFSLWSLLGIR